MHSDTDGDLVTIRGGLIPGSAGWSSDPEEATRWEQVSPREIAAAEWNRFEGYVAEIFEERSRTVTTVWRGAYDDSPELRRDFLQIVRAADRAA
jgi:hypothetical protein